MSTLPLPKALTQRRTNSLDQEKENFEKSQAISISKAVNSQECPVKEKHVRSTIIGTFHEKGAHTFWSIVLKLPLQENPIVCWKFCHVVHKLLREGYHRVIPDSLRYRQTFLEFGKLWGLLKEGYGKLIQCYCRLIVAKLNFHYRNPKFPGNLVVSDDALDDIGEGDVNVFFQVTCEMFDYMDEILALQQAVFGSLDMARSNSMTNSGQCRLAPLIPCIQDSSQLYDYIVKVLFKLHAALPADTLAGHRERFLKQFKLLQQFYLSSVNLQYFKHLIQVPLLPENPPNFLVASDLSSHVSPVVILPPQNETPENEPVDATLVDTSIPQSEKFDQVIGHLVMFGSGGDVSDLNSTESDDSEKDRLIAQLMRENCELRMELQRVRVEDQRAMDDLRRQLAAMDSQLAEHERTIRDLGQEKEVLQTTATTGCEATKKAEELEKKAKANEEKFHKMKEVYNKLREEHIGLLRAKADIEKQFTSVKTVAENAEKVRQSLEERLKEVETELARGKEEHEAVVSALGASHSQFQQELRTREASNLFRILVGVIHEAEAIVGNSLEELDRPGRHGYMGTPESLLQLSLITSQALDRLNGGFEKFSKDSQVGVIHEAEAIVGNSLEELDRPGRHGYMGTPDVEDLIQSVCPLAHSTSQLIGTGKGVSEVSPNIELGEELALTCRNLGQRALVLLKSLRSEGDSRADEVRSATEALQKSLEAVSASSRALSTSLGEADTRKLGDMVEEELSQMDKAIEEAAKRIQDMLEKSREGDSGIKLEVNSKILDACTGIMQAIRELVKSSKHLQEEIVGKEKGSASKKEFYSRNHRWTEGLISAAKVVGIGANFLVDAADKVVGGRAKFEELVVASLEIAGATAQLVVASKVKAARGSERLSALSKASRGVSEATGNVVATAKACAQMVEDSEVLDFSRLTLHQAKRLEMDSQVRVLELESSLQKERVQLAGLRKRHYHLAGASEGWDVREENGTA
ncbi:huntingtin interacting protein, putative [Ixodes scapularis]|uniref:Huntingtin interacting protein, putative n=1 Tax=Ixodes scapularis TaxID=6945 RepID=B7QKD3_IXOSC|nr:huntingtin interacting protein, putative [Ixodes scapularis]|eukprot:XP_002415638.1 huntingtin interacting protein, putative [Ixodes scapularis]